MSYTTEKTQMYWLLVGLVRSLKSSHKEAPRNKYKTRSTGLPTQQPGTNTSTYTLHRLTYTTGRYKYKTRSTGLPTQQPGTNTRHAPQAYLHILTVRWNWMYFNSMTASHTVGSPGIYRKSRVLYSCHRFLSSATWPSILKKHYNGLS